jgi:simple sugar transport system permease protein
MNKGAMPYMWNKKAFKHQPFFIRRNSDILILSLVMIFVYMGMVLFSPGQFLRSSNFESMAFQMPELGILALAMMIAMLSGGINLSIIASANLSGIIMALILTKLKCPGITEGLLITLAILAGLAVSFLIGVINGWIIAFLEVSPILATLGTMMLIDGISLLITKGYVISGYPDAFQYIGNGFILRIPVPLIILIIMALIITVFLNRTISGQSIYIMGSNNTAAKFSGINVKTTLLKTYAVSGILSGVAAIIMTSRFNSASQGYSASYLLITVLLAVLGGVDPNGGFGKVSGLMIALIILQIIASGMNIFGLSSYLTLALWGIILLVVMGIRTFTVNKGRV